MSKKSKIKAKDSEELERLRHRVVELEASAGSQSQSDQIYQLLFNNLSDAIFVHHGPDSDGIPGRFLEVNDTACRRLGYTREQLLQKGPSDIDAPETIPQIAPFMERLIAQKYNIREGAHLTKNGRRIPVEITSHIFERNGITTILSSARDITDRKRAEEEQQHAMELLEAAIHQSPSGILVADAPDVTIRLANPAALGIRGESSQPLTDIAVDRHSITWQTFHPDGEPYLYEDLPLSRAVLKGETTRGEEAIIRSQDGEDHWVSVNAAPIRDKDGKITAGIVIFHDITERKLAEENLRENEDRYRNLVETIPDGFYRSTPNGRFVDVNPAMVKMLGYDSKEELLSIDIPSELYFRREDRDPGQITNQDFTGETEIYQLRKKDGTGIWLEDRCRYLRDESGRIRYHQGVCRDISSRKLSEDAIRESEQQFRLVWDNSADGMRLTDEKGTVRRVNEAFCRMVGKKRSELEGKSLAIIFEKEQQEHVALRYRERFRSRTIEAHLAREITLWNGRKIWIEATNSFLEFEGQPTLSLGIFRDLTEHKRAEELTESLYKISQAIYSTTGLHELFQHIHHALSSIIPANNFFIALLTNDEKAIYFPYKQDEKDTDEWAPIEVDDPKSLTVEVLRSKRPLLLNEEGLQKRHSSDKNKVWGTAPKCWLGVPLMIGVNAIGVMAVQDYNKEDVYRQKDVALFELAAGQIAIAIERKRTEAERERLIHELQEAVADINTLSGLVPICSNCKKIRDDTGYWTQLEAFIQERSKARFSHGICPDCMVKLYPEYIPKKKE